MLAYHPTFGRPLAAYLNLCTGRAYVPHAEYDENRGVVTATFDHRLDVPDLMPVTNDVAIDQIAVACLL
jgi:hypothetical protein